MLAGIHAHHPHAKHAIKGVSAYLFRWFCNYSSILCSCHPLTPPSIDMILFLNLTSLLVQPVQWPPITPTPGRHPTPRMAFSLSCLPVHDLAANWISRCQSFIIQWVHWRWHSRHDIVNLMSSKCDHLSSQLRPPHRQSFSTQWGHSWHGIFDITSLNVSPIITANAM